MKICTYTKGPVNYTVVGSPTINNNIISGFSTSKYLDLTNAFNPGTKHWEILFKVKTGSDITTESYYFRSAISKPDSEGRFGITLGLYNKHFTMGISFNGTSWTTLPSSSYTVIASTDYWLKASWDGTQYYLAYSTDGTNFTKTIEYNSTDNLYSGLLVSQIGVYSYSNGYKSAWKGSIDLNETAIHINNDIWFGKGFGKVKLCTRIPGLNDYTVIGSPTIVDGVVSGFSSSNYLTIPNINTKYAVKTVEFCFCLNNVGANGSGYRQYFSMTNFSLCISNGGGVGVNYSGSSYYNWNTPPATGDVYIITKIDIPNNIFTISWTVDHVTYKTSQHTPSTDIELDSIIDIGKGGIGAIEKIDMSKSYIKINDEVWYGKEFGKTKTYSFSGYYEFENGKLIWANPNIYLEGTGTQYIDTGFKANQNTRVVCRFSPNSISTSQFIFSSRTDYNNAEYGFGIVNSVFRDTWNTGAVDSGITPIIGQIYTADKNKNKTYLDGQLIQTNTSSTFSSTRNLMLFCSPAGTPGNFYKGKIYNTQVYDNGNLIRHLVPVPKGLLIGNYVTPSIGMFDIINQQFYSNAGTGTLNIGGIPENYIIKNDNIIWCNDKIYLQNNGTNNWIDTEFTAKDNGYTYESDIQFVGTSRQLMGFGGNAKEYWGYTSNTKFELGRAEYITVTSANNRVKAKFTWSYTGTSAYVITEVLDIDGTSVTTVTDNGSTMNAVINNNKHYFIFKLNGYNGLYCNAKLYSHKVYDSNNNIISYAIPVETGLQIYNYTIPSNGMWDIVNKKFYPNAGVGEFIYGKDE